MKISNHFKNLRNNKALLVVAGKLSAKIYRINRGNLTEEGEVMVLKTPYTDKPGVFRSNGKGTKDRTGAVQEISDVHEQHTFFRVLGQKLKGLNVPYEKLYLFAPHKILNLIKKNLPKDALDRLEKSVDGNFLKSHPTELLERLESSGGAGPEPLFTSYLAAKTYTTGQQASHAGPKRRIA